jgi:hypothetical protein
VMAKNSREGNQDRNKRYREALAVRGIRPIQVLVPESAHPLIRQAAGLMSRDDDPLEPRAALRLAGGSNEPNEVDASPELRAELEAAKARIAQIEREAEAERQRKGLEAELNASKAAAVAERGKARAMSIDLQAAAIAAEAARGQATEALGRAAKAEAAIRQARSLPGLKGRLVRWLAGDMLEQQADEDKGIEAKFP